ncbi:Uncharacterised protein [Limosilactobacillus oris]|nr:Uncharacterised protein [Limosilactobacillus oris]
MKRIGNRHQGYVMITSLVVLSCICITLIFQYHYYATQYQLEKQLTDELVLRARQNLSQKIR